MKYQVVVGNIGLVFESNNKQHADIVFNHYKRLSIKGIGRGAGESVTLWCEGKPLKDYTPPEDPNQEVDDFIHEHTF